MRAYVIFVVLILLFGAVAAHLLLRSPRSAAATPEVLDAAAPAVQGEADAGVVGVATAAPDATPVGEEAAASVVDAAPEPDALDPEADALAPTKVAPPSAVEAGTPAATKFMDRPLRVIGLGWDLLAPGLWAEADGGVAGPAETAGGESSRFHVQGLEVTLTVGAERLDIERALAEGGDDPAGADVALVPLTTFIAASEDLAPLSPRIFMVAGWSSGQHELLARDWAGDEVPTTTPTGGELQLVARRGSPEHFLALFVLDLAGIPADRVTVMAADADDVDSAPLVARRASARRGVAPAAGDLVPLVTTGQAAQLIPYVAIASEGVVEQHGPALEVFARIWLDAGAEVATRIPDAARLVGSFEGAPESLDLLGPLSRQRPASLEENARLAGLAGTGGMTLERLCDAVSGLWLEAGVISTPPRPATPIAAELVATIVLAGLAERAAALAATPAAGAGQGGTALPAWAEAELGDDGLQRLLLMRPAAFAATEQDQLAAVAFMAAVFEPLPLRVQGSLEAARLGELVTRASDRFGIPTERVRAPVAGLTSGIEVLRRR